MAYDVVFVFVGVLCMVCACDCGVRLYVFLCVLKFVNVVVTVRVGQTSGPTASPDGVARDRRIIGPP